MRTGAQANRLIGVFAVSIYSFLVSTIAVVSAVVLLARLVIWSATAIVITFIDSTNAAEIIAATGAHFPLRKL